MQNFAKKMFKCLFKNCKKRDQPLFPVAKAPAAAADKIRVIKQLATADNNVPCLRLAAEKTKFNLPSALSWAEVGPILYTNFSAV